MNPGYICLGFLHKTSRSDLVDRLSFDVGHGTLQSICHSHDVHVHS